MSSDCRENIPPPKLLYGLDDHPPQGRTLMYGLQWMIIFLPNLTVLSVLVAGVLGLDTAGGAALFQRLLLITGLTMIVQTVWGHRLPLLDGPALALVVTMATLADGGWPVIAGGMVFGGVMLFLCGALGLMRSLTRLFTDRVIGVIVLLISLAVLPFLTPMLLGINPGHPAGQPLVYALSLSLILLMSLMVHHLRGLWQSLAIFWGVLLGVIVFAVLGLVDFSPARSVPWFALPALPAGDFLPRFTPAAMISFTLAYLAVLVNAMGSLFAVEPMLSPGHMDKRLDRGLMMSGLSGLAAGFFGSIGTVPYSTSPGVIAVTGVGARVTVTVCGIMLAAMAFLGKLTALLAAVPDAVVGAALITAMGAQVGAAVEIIKRNGSRLTTRDYMIVGIPVMLGTAASLAPKAFLELLPGSLRPILGNGLVVGVLLVLLLEHVILKEKKTAA